MEFSFEWARRKAAANMRKHGIAFEEAIPVLGDPLARVFDDPGHSEGEVRGLIVCHSTRRRRFVVCFVQRADRIRIVSARRATRQERRDYEEGIS